MSKTKENIEHSFIFPRICITTSKCKRIRKNCIIIFSTFWKKEFLLHWVEVHHRCQCVSFESVSFLGHFPNAHTHLHAYKFYVYRCTAVHETHLLYFSNSPLLLARSFIVCCTWRGCRRHCNHCLRALPILESADSSHLFCIRHLCSTWWKCKLMYVISHPRWMYVMSQQ